MVGEVLPQKEDDLMASTKRLPEKELGWGCAYTALALAGGLAGVVSLLAYGAVQAVGTLLG